MARIPTVEGDGREVVLITGHRNPDMDSVCAAVAYARLKNAMDPQRRYVPVQSGLNDLTKAQFSRLGIDPPVYLADISPRVADVVRAAPVTLAADDPLRAFCEIYTANPVTVVPLLNGDEYAGLLSIDDVTSWFIRGSSTGILKLPFDLDNFAKVMSGRWVRRGPRFVTASITLAVSKFERLRDVLKRSDDLPILVLGERRKYIELAVDTQVPAIVLVGVREHEQYADLWEKYTGSVFLVAELTSDQVFRQLQTSIPLRALLGAQPPTVSPQDGFEQVRELLSKSTFAALPVIGVDGKFHGIVTRNEFLRKPRRKVILVDHNEEAQSVLGIESAEVFEIIDHHRFAPPKTQLPIFIDCEPLGSTCTLIYGLYRRYDAELDCETAKVLLSGLLSDTVLLRSPTTTSKDRTVAQNLAQIARVNLMRFGEELFSGGASITTQDPTKLIGADFKVFDEEGVKFGIGQCEVVTFQGVADVRATWLKTLEEFKERHALEWAMVIVTNIIAECSVLLSTSHRVCGELKYRRMDEGQYDCPGVLSRKVQVLPEVIRAIAAASA